MDNAMGGFSMPLTECRSGDQGTVIDVAGTCETSKRLAEMGVHAGSYLRIMRCGSPMIVESNNTRICLRAEMAESVIIALGSEAPSPVPDMGHAAEASRIG